MDGWIQPSCCPSFTPPCLCVTQEARPQHLWMLISCLSDYSQHHGRKCRQCEPAWGPCPGSVYGWPGCYSHNNYPPPLSRTETDGSLRLMHSCEETGEGGGKNVIKVPKDKQDTHSKRVNYLNGNSNLCTLDKRTNRMSLCLCGFPLRLADVKLDVQQKKKQIVRRDQNRNGASVWVLTGRSWQGGTSHRQVSSLGTWATRMQQAQKACSNTHPCTCSFHPEGGQRHTHTHTQYKKINQLIK